MGVFDGDGERAQWNSPRLGALERVAGASIVWRRVADGGRTLPVSKNGIHVFLK